MDSMQTKSGLRGFSLRSVGMAGSMALLMGLSACGGSGATTQLANSALLPTTIIPKSCSNISGNLDVLQSALLTQLKPAVQTLPAVGASAARATTALSQTLDSVDAISNALTTLAQTQNLQQFTTQLAGAGDSLLCSSYSLSDSLAQLAITQSAPIPGLAQAQQALAQTAQRVADGLVGSAPGADLTQLTTQLLGASAQLQSLANNLPTSINQPYLTQVLKLNATGYHSLAQILGDLGALNGNQLAADVSSLLLAGASSLQLPLATQFGVPTTALSPVVSQFLLAAQGISSGLGAVAGPTLHAVSAVLSTATGAVPGTTTLPFADLVDGSLTSTGSATTTTRVAELSTLLGGNSGLTLLNSLLQSFGGVLPI